MRDYQRKRNNPYVLPWNLYREMLYAIRDYDRLVEEYNNRLEEGMSPESDSPSGGKTNRTGDPTGMKVVKLSEISRRILAIDKARMVIPEEYMNGIWNNIIKGTAYPRNADPRTYGTWKGRFVYEVARNLNRI